MLRYAALLAVPYPLLHLILLFGVGMMQCYSPCEGGSSHVLLQTTSGKVPDTSDCWVSISGSGSSTSFVCRADKPQQNRNAGTVKPFGLQNWVNIATTDTLFLFICQETARQTVRSSESSANRERRTTSIAAKNVWLQSAESAPNKS